MSNWEELRSRDSNKYSFNLIQLLTHVRHLGPPIPHGNRSFLTLLAHFLSQVNIQHQANYITVSEWLYLIFIWAIESVLGWPWQMSGLSCTISMLEKLSALPLASQLNTKNLLCTNICQVLNIAGNQWTHYGLHHLHSHTLFFTLKKKLGNDQSPLQYFTLWKSLSLPYSVTEWLMCISNLCLQSRPG